MAVKGLKFSILLKNTPLTQQFEGKIMSQTLGRMLICDRCGVAVFEPMRKAKGDEGWQNNCIFFEHESGWIAPSDYNLNYDRDNIVNCETTLCPECEAERKNVMKKFWSNE